MPGLQELWDGGIVDGVGYLATVETRTRPWEMTDRLYTRRVRWGVRDTTYVIVAGDPDVAIFAPISTPRIPHFPIIYATICAVAHKKNTMIQLGSACSIIEDATM